MTKTNDTQSNLTFVAVDGGGTRCRLALCGADGITSVEVGSANISTDFNAATLEIIKGLRRLAGKTGISLERLSQMPTYLGLAGITGPDMARDLAKVLPIKQALIEDDRPSALRGALGKKDGIIAHCGTGSFFAAQTKEDMRFIGGWGPILGDPASAQWVGRRALTRTLDVVDGVLPNSGLSAMLLDRFGGAPGIVAFASRATPVEFGRIAQDITNHAHDGDTLGRALMVEAANKVVTALNMLDWAPGTSICLTGGIGPQYAPYLPDDMRASLSKPAGIPLDGAISLGRIFCQDIASRKHP